MSSKAAKKTKETYFCQSADCLTKKKNSEGCEEENAWDLLGDVTATIGTQKKKQKPNSDGQVEAEYYCGLHEEFSCSECFFARHEMMCTDENHIGVGSIKSLLTREYQRWSALAQRPNEIQALYNKNVKQYGYLIKVIKQATNFDSKTTLLSF
jgi:hypothetical protein